MKFLKLATINDKVKSCPCWAKQDTKSITQAEIMPFIELKKNIQKGVLTCEGDVNEGKSTQTWFIDLVLTSVQTTKL